VSADYETANLKGYSHSTYVYVVRKGDPDDKWSSESPLGSFTPEEVSELQSITDQWKRDQKEEAEQ
jgi:lysylphosphatidylglycerol synthetase-like protein (DUF2156 family)